MTKLIDHLKQSRQQMSWQTRSRIAEAIRNHDPSTPPANPRDAVIWHLIAAGEAVAWEPAHERTVDMEWILNGIRIATTPRPS